MDPCDLNTKIHEIKASKSNKKFYIRYMYENEDENYHQSSGKRQWASGQCTDIMMLWAQVEVPPHVAE